MRSLCVLMWLLLAPLSHADTIFVVRRGWHVDLGLAVTEMAPPLDAVASQFPGAKFLLLGFGDRRYLMAKHSHVPAMLGAVWPGKSLILATGLISPPEEAFGETWVVKLNVSTAQSHELQAFIAKSLRVDDKIVIAAPGPYGGSLYFDSELRYSGLHTCNTWAAEGLKSAELPVRSKGTVFAGQLWRQVTKLTASRRVN